MIDAMKAVSIAEAQGESFKASRLSVGSSHWFVGVRDGTSGPVARPRHGGAFLRHAAPFSRG